jgi:Ca-activated chloride channel family protein
LATVKLRYKLPYGETSRLIERPVEAALLRDARLPGGDMAFAVSVAGFAQKLRGDTLLGNWGYPDIRRLAGSQWSFSQQGYWRQEFLKLVDMAETRTAPDPRIPEERPL